MTAELLDLTLVEAAKLTRTGQVSARELVSASLSRIDATQQLAAFVLVDADGASRAAAALDDVPARLRGPLHGVPIAIKDIFDVAGHPTRRGSSAFADAPPALTDAHAVRLLRDAGAVIVGKTRTHELACGVYTSPTGNPWDPGRSAGGSSGGSGAAVGARAVFGATGSDTGGSIRIPAALCGVVGLKPTYGRVSRTGVAALAWSLDHIGPLARTVEDAWLMFAVLAGSDTRDPATVGLPELDAVPRSEVPFRVGVPEDMFQDGLTREVEAVWANVLTTLSAGAIELIPFRMPALHSALETEFAIVLAEAATYYERLLRQRPEALGVQVRELLTAGQELPALTYLRAQQARGHLQRAFATTFNSCRLDAVITPTLPGTAQRPDQVYVDEHGQGETVADGFVRTTGPFNLTGMPCVSLFAGLGHNGLPVAVQLAGRPYGEMHLQNVARSVEELLGRAPRPPVAHPTTP
jgi:aspartyl-tRNA(Asn)/glutamyl-tRNA(Gln) amidotransferase subunit A